MFWDCCHLDLLSGFERFELVYPSLGLCLSAQHWAFHSNIFSSAGDKRFLCWSKCKDEKPSWDRLIWFTLKEKCGRRFSKKSKNLQWIRRETSLFQNSHTKWSKPCDQNLFPWFPSPMVIHSSTANGQAPETRHLNRKGFKRSGKRSFHSNAVTSPDRRGEYREKQQPREGQTGPFTSVVVLISASPAPSAGL